MASIGDFLGDLAIPFAGPLLAGGRAVKEIGGEVSAGKERRAARKDILDKPLPDITDPGQAGFLDQLRDQRTQTEGDIEATGQRLTEQSFQEQGVIQSDIETLRRKQGAVNTGTAFANDLQQISQAQSTTQRNILRAGGTGAQVIAGLTATQSATGGSINEALATGRDVNFAFENIIQGLGDRRRDLLSRRQDIDINLLNTGIESRFGFNQQEAAALDRAEDRELDLFFFERSETRQIDEARRLERMGFLNQILSGLSDTATAAIGAGTTAATGGAIAA